MKNTLKMTIYLTILCLKKYTIYSNENPIPNRKCVIRMIQFKKESMCESVYG